MSPETFALSSSAMAQMSLLNDKEKEELFTFFSSITKKTPAHTKKIEENLRASRVGKKRVIWKVVNGDTPFILSIVDEGYTYPKFLKAHTRA